MSWELAGMLCGSTALALIGQLPVDNPAESLGKGTAQMVLGVVVLGLAWAYHRKDVKHQADWEKWMQKETEREDKTRTALTDTAVAITKAGDTMDDVQDTMTSVQDTMRTLRDAVNRCPTHLEVPPKPGG